MKHKNFLAGALCLLLLAGCGRAVPPAASPPPPEPSSSEPSGESSSGEPYSSIPISHPEEPCATPYPLSELGYYFAQDVDTGQSDPNPPMELDILPGVYPKQPPYYFSMEQHSAYLDSVGMYLIGYYGAGNLWGKYTVVQPDCGYAGGFDHSVVFAILQAFKREDIEAPQAHIEFIKGNQESNNVVHYALPVAQLEEYKVYEDEDIVVYDFLPFTDAPSYAEQMQLLAQERNYDERGIQWRWFIDVGEFFHNAPGGIGSFIHKMDRPWLNNK